MTNEQEQEQSFSKNGSSWSLSEGATNKENEESEQDDASKLNTASNSTGSSDQNKALLKRDREYAVDFFVCLHEKINIPISVYQMQGVWQRSVITREGF